MEPTEKMKPLSEISSVYSGRDGCACGCRGKHTSSPRSIKIIYNKILKAPREEVDNCYDTCYGYVTPTGRLLIAYFDGRKR